MVDMALSGNSTNMAILNHTITVPTTVFIPTTVTVPPAISVLTESVTATITVQPMAPIQRFLSELPSCIQSVAVQGLDSSGCGTKQQCVCTDSLLLVTLKGAMEQACSADDMEKTQTAVHQLCPNLNDSRSKTILAILIVTLLLAVSSVILRIISRKVGNVRFWWDDWLIILATIIAIGESANYFISIHNGLGRHFFTLNPTETTNFLKTFWITQVLFAFSITLTKLSILFFYRRIFFSRSFLIKLIIAGCFMIAWFLAQFISVILSCRPLAFFWDKTLGGKCINENTTGYAITGVSLLTDLAVFCLPISQLWKMQKSVPQRLGLIGLFLVGAICCIAGILRIPFLVQLDELDVTWSITLAGIWIQVEVKIGIFCTCLPTLMPLFRALRTHISRLSSNSSGSSQFNRLPREMAMAPQALHSPEKIAIDHNIIVNPAGILPNTDRSPKQRGWFSAALSNLTHGGGSTTREEELHASEEEMVRRELSNDSSENEVGELK